MRRSQAPTPTTSTFTATEAFISRGVQTFAERITGTLFLEADCPHLKALTGKRYGVTASRQKAEAMACCSH